MVLSVVAIGAAGFAGSTAAPSVESPESIAANPTDVDADSDHVIVIPITSDEDGAVYGTNNDTVISYSADDFGTSEIAALDDVEVEIVDTDGIVTNLTDGGTGVSASATNNTRTNIQVRITTSVLEEHYLDYSPRKLKQIYDNADLTVLE
ncbi:MAG: hypothetical protein J07HQW1_02935 [Haloquadratum walsbyi J07HQW1]|jgi:hypothetical protein|uniref:Uncharacterized protein n=1 Tax=Haloquadratum walsbyi J07HQW1 TaxID=1238424 RepID=U1PL05_9EURY|nr:MAG: hypothetical protein J07HQW1_02935 [Haloquadratum walsbyi J07HQW1]